MRRVSGFVVALAFAFASAGSAQQTTPDQQKRSSHTKASGVAPATLLLQADMECSFRLDGQPGVALKTEEMTKLSATLGEHLLTAKTLDGRDRWRQVVDLRQPGQKVVLIELVKVRAARQTAERQVVQLQQEIAATEQQAAATRVATKQLNAQQEAVKQKRKQVEDQIDGLQKEMREKERQAQSEESQAQQAQQATPGVNPTSSLGQLGSLVGSIAADRHTISARSLRAHVGQIQDDIAGLNRQLERIDGGELEDQAPTSTVGSGGPGSRSAPATGVAASAYSFHACLISHHSKPSKRCRGPLTVDDRSIFYQGFQGDGNLYFQMSDVVEAKRNLLVPFEFHIRMKNGEHYDFVVFDSTSRHVVDPGAVVEAINAAVARSGGAR